MTIPEAINVLEVLEKSTNQLTALLPEENPGLAVHHRMGIGKEILVYVDRQELINFIKRFYKLESRSCTLSSKINPEVIRLQRTR